MTKDHPTQKKASLLPYRGFFDDFTTSVQIIAEQIGRFNKNLKEKQFFFYDIIKEGVVLYDSGDFKLAKPKKLTLEEMKELNEENFN